MTINNRTVLPYNFPLPRVLGLEHRKFVQRTKTKISDLMFN